MLPRLTLLTLASVLLQIPATFGMITVLSNEQKLHHYITKSNNYNKNIRPEGDNPKGSLTVKLSIKLSQILDVSEKNQIFASSLWLRHEWSDPRLRWDPRDVGGLNYTYIPSDDLWRPDIVLYNNADGEFVISLMTKATVYHTGRIVWNPPAIYKSYCPIDVEFFPFDVQECFMKFGSWTNDIHSIDLQHEWQFDTGIAMNNETFIPNGVDLCHYSPNVEWDVINVTAKMANKFYPCCQDDPFPYLMFNVTIRRRTLFYTINLILPIIAISTLTVLVFYLPSDSGEKITLSISILLALTVFFLLLSDINPPTSLVIPLIAKYLLFTMIVVTMSIFLTVYTLSVNFRNPSTHEMSSWTRRIFTEILPKILCMKRPTIPNNELLEFADSDSGSEVPALPETPEISRANPEAGSPQYENIRRRTTSSSSEQRPKKYQSQMLKASVKGVKFIAHHMRQLDEENMEELDWNYVAMIMDRMFLYIFTMAAFCGTAGIFLNAPSLYDPRAPLPGPDFNCSR